MSSAMAWYSNSAASSKALSKPLMFATFLGAMRSRKRKQCRKERRKVAAALGEQGAIEWIDGSDMSEQDVRAMDGLYRSTTDQHWGRAYLEPGFFAAARELIRRTLTRDGFRASQQVLSNTIPRRDLDGSQRIIEPVIVGRGKGPGGPSQDR